MMTARRPYHPLCAALLPVAILLSRNIGEATPASAIRPAVLLLAAAACCWGLFWALLKSVPKSAAMTTAIMLLVFSPGYVVPVALGRPTLAPVLVIILALLPIVIVGVAFLRANLLPDLTSVLNITLACLVAVPAANVAYHITARHTSNVAAAEPAVDSHMATVEKLPETSPDIFYIILDAYGRADVLKRMYDYDNSEFLSFLQSRGFRVCPQAHSNYCQTVISLASSLNMEYIGDEVEAQGSDPLIATRYPAWSHPIAWFPS